MQKSKSHLGGSFSMCKTNTILYMIKAREKFSGLDEEKKHKYILIYTCCFKYKRLFLTLEIEVFYSKTA